jgi:hypothetical protein
VKRAIAPVAAIVAAVMVFAIWIGNDRSATERVFDRYSVENTSDDGLSLAFRYLQRTGHRATRLERTLHPRSAAANGVVFRLGTIREPFDFEEDEEDDEKPQDKKKIAAAKKPRRVSPQLTAEEEGWVRGGGRLVLGFDGESGPLDTRGVTLKSAHKVFPQWPGVDTIALRDSRAFAAATLPAHMVTLYEAANQTVIARQSIGAGDLIVVAVPDILQNAALGSGNHLELLTAMTGNRPVYFDETIHGLEHADGAVALLKEWGLGPFLLLAMGTGVLIVWRRAARIGAPEDDHRELRSDAVDLVASLGALYRKAMSDGRALALYRETLVRSVAAHTGLRGDALQRRVSTITRGTTPAGETKLSAAAMRRHLETLNEGFRSLEGRRARRAPGEPNANHR